MAFCVRSQSAFFLDKYRVYRTNTLFIIVYHCQRFYAVFSVVWGIKWGIKRGMQTRINKGIARYIPIEILKWKISE